MAGETTFPSIDSLPTADQRWEALLDLMSVPNHPGLYVLGCFAPRVTFLSQQVRALNLVDALCKTGRVSSRSKVAVVGAGVAGLTAAAGLAVRGVPVTLFERYAGRLMPLQRESGERWVHPHIYDWPVEQSLEKTAGLEILDWGSNKAQMVIEEIENNWKSLPQDVRDRIEVQDKREIRIDENGRLIWGDNLKEDFRAVILAVGFGVEEETGTSSYWTNDGIDSVETERKKGRWLVSGVGDGGLTDLMRLCILNFRHGDVLYKFAEHARDSAPEIARDLLDAEADSSADYFQKYQQAAEKFPQRLVDRREIKVFLNCDRERLFLPGSSILNRLIVACLLRWEAFKLVDAPGRIRVPVEWDGKRFEVIFEKEDKTIDRIEYYDHVIVRHGPKSALKNVVQGKLWEACRKKKEIWDLARRQQGIDWTRTPLWKKGEFTPGGGEIPPLRIDWGEKVGCLVVVPDGGAGLATGYVNQALKGLSKILRPGWIGSRSLANRSEVIEIGKAFATPDRYARTIQALCQAEIVVFHIDGYDCAGLLLLGIRSAARRGVTITALSEPLDDATWARLPFNLREIKPLSLAGDRGDFASNLTKAIGAGFEKMSVLPRGYLDLPSYDAVRNLGSESHHYRPFSPSEQVLILSSFGERYLKTPEAGPFVKSAIDTVCAEPGSHVAIRIGETPSPQLVSQRLHEAIRRCQLCIVDWTEWKANVFYEFGVRLATNKIEPLCIFKSDWPASEENEDEKVKLEKRKRHAAALQALFDPVDYSEADFLGFEEKVERHRSSISQVTPDLRQRGLLSPGFTYRVVMDAIDIRREPGGVPVTRVLEGFVNEMIGQGPIQQGTLPPLYSDHPRLWLQLQESALEHLLAAWYYLHRRARLDECLERNEFSSQDPRLEEFLDIGNRIIEVLDSLGGHEDLKAEVGEVLDRFESIGRVKK